MSLFGALKGPGDEKIDFKEARASALDTWATEAGEEGK